VTVASLEVILAAYNDPGFVAAALAGYLAQLDSDFSLAIADDGSGPEIRALVGRFAERGLKVRHVWHEDLGFRKARIVNQAIGSSDADFIVLSDSDCIPGPRFIGDHRAWAIPGCLSAGRRVELGPEVSSGLVEGRIPLEKLTDMGWVFSRDLVGKLDSGRYAVRFPGWIVRSWNARTAGGAMGANLGVWRDDLVRVNGFDNEFEGWGGEDDDLVWRLQASGVREQSVRGRAVVFHLHHEPREAARDNSARFAERRRTGEYRVRSGIVDDA